MAFKTYSTYLPDYTIKVETYPYTESKELVKSLDHWWDHGSRTVGKHKDSKSNYDIEGDGYNTLKYSFDVKLIDGNFSFFCNNNQIIAYQGLLIMDNGDTCLAHRATTNPEEYHKHVGLWTSVYLPWHIKSAYDFGCKKYKVSWNSHNFRSYRLLRDHIAVKKFKYHTHENLWQKFDFVGTEQLFNCEQYVAVLDLTTEWAKNFIGTLLYETLDPVK